MPGRPPRKVSRNLYIREGVYWAHFKAAGIRYRRSLRTTDVQEARRRLKDWRATVDRERFTASETPSYKAAVLKWEAEVLPRAVKPAVAERYMVSIRQITPFFLDLRVDQITKKTIATFISARGRQGASNATVRRDLTALSRLLAACIAWGWIEENHARYFDRSIIRETKRVIRPPSAAEVDALVAVAPPGMAAVLRLLDQTGMREEEAVTLERWQVTDQQITLTETKTSRPRTLAWRTPGGDATAALAAGEPKGFLYRTETGAPYQNFASNAARVMRDLVAREKAAGRTFRRFRPHDLRHGFAIRWLKAGGDIYRLSRHLGHTSVKTTEIYLGYLTEEEQEAVRTSGAALGSIRA